jgi:hypothetical protein
MRGSDCRYLLIAVAGVALVCAGCTGGTPAATHSPSYQMGYDAAAPKPGSPGPRNLSDADVSQLCSNLLQARVDGAALGTNSQLPPDFSSQDFLAGCTDAGQALLGSR